MEAKQKAKALVEQFMPYMYCYMGSGMLSNDYDIKVANDNAKQCALICVDEIIKSLEGIDDTADDGYGYWGQVKKQIELL